MRIRCFAAAAAAILLSGCSDWVQPWFGPSHTRFNPDETTLTAANIDQVEPLWTSDTAGQPIIAGSRGFTTFSEGGTIGVRAFAVATGDQLWETQLATGLPFTFMQRAAFSGSELWVPHLAGMTMRISVVDPATGDVIRTIPTGFVLTPVVTDGLTAVWRETAAPTDAPEQLVVLDRATNTTAWTFTFPTLASDAPRSDGTPTLGDGRIYVNHGGLLYAFDAAGCGQSECQPLWTYNTWDQPKEMPIVGDDGRVYFVEPGTGTSHGQTSSYGRLLALDDTGAEVGAVTVTGIGGVFDNPSAGISGVAVADGVAYMLSWQQSTVPPDMATVYRLRAFDLQGGCLGDGCLLWSAELQGGGPVVGGDVLYVGTSGGIAAFAADGCGAGTCSPLTTLPFTGGGNIVVAQGKVFAGGPSLTAFGLPE